MKLFKQLLPVATIASVAAITAPIISSCSCGTEFCSWTRGQKYKPMSQKQGKTIIGTDDDLTKEYEFDLKANGKKHFSDDFVNYISLADTSIYDQDVMLFTVNSIKHKTTNVGDGNTTLGGGKYAFPISYTMTLIADAVITTNGNNKSNLSYKNAQITFTNMPVKLVYFESAGVLGKEGDIAECGPVDTNSLIANKNWSIDMPELKHDTSKDIFTLGENREYSYKDAPDLQEDNALLQAFSSLVRFFTIFESNYYFNIELSQPVSK